jgi:hypothetical protein
MSQIYTSLFVWSWYIWQSTLGCLNCHKTTYMGHLSRPWLKVMEQKDSNLTASHMDELMNKGITSITPSHNNWPHQLETPREGARLLRIVSIHLNPVSQSRNNATIERNRRSTTPVIAPLNLRWNKKSKERMSRCGCGVFFLGVDF